MNDPQAGRAGQRAHVTLLFSDVSDFTGLSELSDPEEVDSFRRRIEELGERVIRRHRGVLTQCYGDGMLALFGYPGADEDASRHAVEAALELHRLAREVASPAPNFAVRMHSGVHAGLVFVRQGDSLHGRFEITGDAVNTAARLSAAATRDQVLVSRLTLRGVEAFFATEPKLELAIKGKRAPLLVHRVLGRSGVRTRFEARARGGLTPLAGRRAETSKLIRQLEAARAGEGRMVLITGQAGVGKTRLLEELGRAAEDAGALVVRGNCDSYGELPPLEPFLQVLRQLLGIEPTTPASDAGAMMTAKAEELGIAEHAPVLLQLLSLQTSRPRGERADVTAPAAYRAVAALLDAQSRRFTLACVLDDWQWADDVSRRILTRLGHFIRDRRVCVYVAAREELHVEPGFEPDLTLFLSPLTADESREVINVLRSKDLDLGLTAALHQRSGGNPLYLEELCHSLPSDVLGAEALEQASIPNTLQGLIQARISRLDDGHIRVLQRASVVGLEFSTPLLGPQEARAEIDVAVSELVELGLVMPTNHVDTFRFKHGITREVVYNSVLMRERLQMHHEIARELEQRVRANDLPPQPEALAFHYAGSGDYDRAATHAELAGDKAAATPFLGATRAHYERALASLDHLTTEVENKRRWLRVCIKWASQCAFGPTRAQLGTLQRGEALALEIKSNLERAHVHHMLGWFYYVFGEYVASIQHCQIAFELAHQVGDQKLIAQLWNTLGQAHCVAGQYPEALAYLNRGVELKRSLARGDSIAVPSDKPSPRAPAALYSHALSCRALVYADMGDFDSASRDMQEALQIMAGTGHSIEPSVLSHHCIVLVRRGAWQECTATARRTRTIAERANSIYVFGIVSAFVQYSEWRLNPTRAALEELRRAVDWLEGRDFGLYLSFMFAHLAEALYESGDSALAASYARRAVERAASGDPQGEIPGYRVLARLAAERDPSSGEPERYLRCAIDAAQARNSRRELALTSLCAAQLDAQRPIDPPRGVLGLEETAAELDAMDMGWYLAQARELLAHKS